jgi:hypothetical protein
MLSGLGQQGNLLFEDCAASITLSSPGLPNSAWPVRHSTGWFSSVTDLGWCCYRWVGYNVTDNKCRVAHGVQAGDHGDVRVHFLGFLACAGSPEVVCELLLVLVVCVCFGTRSAAVGMVVGFARLLSYAMVWHADSRGEDWVRKGKGGASCFVAVNTLSQSESGLLSAYA